MRLFEIIREKDNEGLSGVGRVAKGCEFDDGRCIFMWWNDVQSIVIHKNMDDLRRVHCKNSRILYNSPDDTRPNTKIVCNSPDGTKYTIFG